jgi:hypothetical protein
MALRAQRNSGHQAGDSCAKDCDVHRAPSVELVWSAKT